MERGFGPGLATNGEGAAGVESLEDEWVYSATMLLEALLLPRSPQGCSARDEAPGASDQGDPEALPIETPPANLVPPNMTVDNTVATFLLDFPLIIEQFDGEFLSGPVPTFFCSDPVAALAALVAIASGVWRRRRHCRHVFVAGGGLAAALPLRREAADR